MLVSLSVSLSACPSVCIFVCLSVCPSVGLSGLDYFLISFRVVSLAFFQSFANDRLCHHIGNRVSDEPANSSTGLAENGFHLAKIRL